jgi:ASC-1-like (ASCH) protein
MLSIMTIYAINVSEPYYSDVEAGKKTVELRLYRGKFVQFAVGDKLMITRKEEAHDGNESPVSAGCTRQIIGVTHYESFAEAISALGLERVMPSAASVETAVAAYRAIYECGGDVVAFELA